ncbi:MAG: hypothetical protein WBD31_07075 [Rubripirellula sp.]
MDDASVRSAYRWDHLMTALFNLPFVSAVFFVLAGVLIGHLLWFRDRTGDNAKINGLENRYIKARGSAKLRKREFVKLRKDNETVDSELQDLRDQYASLQKQNEEHRSAALQAGDKLARLRGERDLSDEKFASELKRSEAMVSQLQEALKLKTSAEHDLEERTTSFTEMQASHRELEVEIESLRTRLDASEKSSSGYLQTIDTLKRQVGEHGQTIVQTEQIRSRLENETTQLREQLEAKTSEAESSQEAMEALTEQLADREESIKRFEQTQIGLETEIEQLTATLDAQAQATDQTTSQNAETIAALRKEVAELTTRTESSEQSLTETQADLVARCEDLDVLRGERDALNAKVETLLDRISDLDAEQEIAGTVKEERDELATDLQSAASSLGEQRQMLEAREHEVEQLRAQVSGLHEQLQKTTERANHVSSEKEAMGDAIANREELIDRLQSQIDELTPLRSELAEVALVLGEQKSVNQQRVQQIETQKSEIEQKSKEIQALRVKLEPMAKIQDELEQHRPLRAELAKAIEQQSAQRQRAAELEDQLSKRTAQVDELQSQVELLDETKSMLAEAQQKIEMTAKQVTQAAGQRDSIAKSRDELETQLKKRAEQIEGLQAQVAVLDQTKQALAQSQQKQAATDRQTTVIAAERDELAKSRSELEKSLVSLRSEIQNQAKATEAANQQLQARAKQHEQSIGEVSELKKTLESQRSSIAKLANQLQAAEQLRPENKELQNRIGDLMAHLKRVSAEHEDSLDANTKALDRIRDLESNLHDHAAKIRDLRRERASIAGLDGRDDAQSIRKAA